VNFSGDKKILKRLKEIILVKSELSGKSIKTDPKWNEKMFYFVFNILTKLFKKTI
jgi:hypothetical protein